jgi:hypothetical protein
VHPVGQGHRTLPPQRNFGFGPGLQG